MKKIFLKFLVVLLALLTVFNNAFSDDCSSNCTIKDKTAQILSDYFSNNRKIINNISKQLTKKKKEPWYYLQKQNIAVYNLIFNWNDTLTSWEYYRSQITAEIPKPMQRDLRKLKNEGENLNKFLKTTLEGGFSSNKIKNVCSGIKHCTFSETIKASDVIKDLVHNNARIIDLYKLSLLGKYMSFSGKGQIILVPKNFESEMNNFYSNYSMLDCTMCDGGFGGRTKKSFKKFLLNTKNGEKGIQEWKNAWNLLRNSHSNTEEIQKLEAKLLRKELSRQGVSSSNATAMLKNLENFNNSGWSSSNNPISSTFNTFVKSIDITGSKKIISDFGQTVANIYGKTTDTTQVSIRDFTNKKNKIGTSNKIMNEIGILYQKQIPFTASHNLNAEKLRAKIIRMHVSLTNAIKTLDKQIPKAIHVCDSQGKGQGKCTTK